MIPVEDSTRRPLYAPVMTQVIIGVSTLVFMLELWEGQAFILRWAFVPAELLTPHGFLTIFTSMFMHAGWVHFLGNMLFFWVFAPQIEDVMGPVSFLIFYVLGGAWWLSRKCWLTPPQRSRALEPAARSQPSWARSSLRTRAIGSGLRSCRAGP
jgi:membrane associated rhomboid family serine protease